jgi:hypothetical protein
MIMVVSSFHCHSHVVMRDGCLWTPVRIVVVGVVISFYVMHTRWVFDPAVIFRARAPSLCHVALG